MTEPTTPKKTRARTTARKPTRAELAANLARTAGARAANRRARHDRLSQELSFYGFRVFTPEAVEAIEADVEFAEMLLDLQRFAVPQPASEDDFTRADGRHR